MRLSKPQEQMLRDMSEGKTLMRYPERGGYRIRFGAAPGNNSTVLALMRRGLIEALSMDEAGTNTYQLTDEGRRVAQGLWKGGIDGGN